MAPLFVQELNTRTHTQTVKNILLLLLLIIKVFAAHATPFEMLTFNSRSNSDFDSRTGEIRQLVCVAQLRFAPQRLAPSWSWRQSWDRVPSRRVGLMKTDSFQLHCMRNWFGFCRF